MKLSVDDERSLMVFKEVLQLNRAVYK